MARTIVVQAGPLAASSATKIGASQKAATVGTNVLVLNGAAADAVANNICASQTPGGAGALLLNGVAATTNPVAGAGGTAAAGAAVAYIPNGAAVPRYIYITGASDESGKTFVVVGTIQTQGSFGPGAIVTETITGPNASVVSSVKQYSTIISITASAGTTGAITVGTNGIATLDTARRVLFTSGGNDSSVVATVTGTDWNGSPASETITLTNGTTTYTLLDYTTITSITTNAAIATVVSIGTNGICSSPPVRFDELAAMGPTALQVDFSGTANATVQQTLNDPNVITNQLPTPTYLYAKSAIHWVNHPDSGLVGATSTVQGNYAYPPTLARLLLNSESGSGYATLTVTQGYLR